jgi:hypothetical protein
VILIRAAFKETTRDSSKEKKRMGRRIEQHQRTPSESNSWGGAERGEEESLDECEGDGW